ncbi:hypothetical protein AAY473_033423 [Plecturocebus cupreus]
MQPLMKNKPHLHRRWLQLGLRPKNRGSSLLLIRKASTPRSNEKPLNDSRQGARGVAGKVKDYSVKQKRDRRQGDNRNGRPGEELADGFQKRDSYRDGTETGFHHVAQTGLELLSSGDPPSLASQSAGITGEAEVGGSQGQEFETSLANETGVQWRDPSSLQPPQHPRNPGSSDSPASASLIAGIRGACHCAQLIFVFLEEMGFHHLGQAGLELLTS